MCSKLNLFIVVMDGLLVFFAGGWVILVFRNMTGFLNMEGL